MKDKLKLKVDAGETYFVHGVIAGGLVIGAADLQPSDRAAFNAAAKTLKLAAAPTEGEPAAGPGAAQPADLTQATSHATPSAGSPAPASPSATSTTDSAPLTTPN